MTTPRPARGARDRPCGAWIRSTGRLVGPLPLRDTPGAMPRAWKPQPVDPCWVG
ncbi:hypothetical protein [Carbonactinospora thermoautotrophica]|uniref:hypothetical protein n=1 Tax=Carbonactinospora thermoautotrophica TaxID=1469144 RepID=UPI000A58ECA1|nr:hypothetical protein [Carbonactinospora thermoautotrophica]